MYERRTVRELPASVVLQNRVNKQTLKEDKIH